MKTLTKIATVLTVLMLVAVEDSVSQGKIVSDYNVVWKSQSENSYGTMPAGNGDVGANVWVTPDGVMHFFISKTDAYSEIGRLLKIGKVSVSFEPAVLKGKKFTQELDLYTGTINIKTDKADLIFRVDANEPVIVLSGKSKVPVTVTVKNEVWRTERRKLRKEEMHSVRGLMQEPLEKDNKKVKEVYVEPDDILNVNDGMAWCHSNIRSIYTLVMEGQGLKEFADSQTDPLLGRTFGAYVFGAGLKPVSEKELVSAEPTKNIDVNVLVKTSLNSTPEKWLNEMSALKKEVSGKDDAQLVKQHEKWWNDFWDRHYIVVTSDKEKEDAFVVTQGYLLQRYINAGSGRGGLPIKFNGSIFTVDIPGKYVSAGITLEDVDADYRRWGGCYWFQNTRLPYWGMLYSGDFEMMKPLFRMYLDDLDLARFRTKKYHRCGGAYLPETMYFWGAYALTDYGWSRDNTLTEDETVNQYIRYYWQGGIELVAMMQDYFLFTGDEEFLNGDLTEFAKEIITFYNENYRRSSHGKIVFKPVHSLETYWYDVVNPLPEIAGLKYITDRFLANKDKIKDKELVELCDNVNSSLTEIPVRTDESGQTLLSPAEKYDPKSSNVENPELYAVFPYEIYGLNRKDREMAKRTYDARKYKAVNGWQQDGIQAALIGDTEEAKRIVVQNFKAKNKESRFPGFFGPNFDWTPDQDHGSVTFRALQNMLIQQTGDSILLMPAWPEGWNCKFKVNAYGNTTLEGEIVNGKVKKLKVVPSERRGDMIVVGEE